MEPSPFHDRRRLDAAPDPALPRARFARHAAPLDRRRRCPRGRRAARGHVAAMDAGGVRPRPAQRLARAEGPLISNDEVAGVRRGARTGFAGWPRSTCAIRWRGARAAALRHRAGLQGPARVPWLWELPPNDRRYYPLYADVRRARRAVLHPGRPHRPAARSETGRPIPYLDDVALDFPDLVIVAGHIGYPWTEEMVALARKYPNVHVDTSAYTVRRYPPELVRYLRADGRKQGHVRHELADDRAGEGARGARRPRARAGRARRFLGANARAVFGL